MRMEKSAKTYRTLQKHYYEAVMIKVMDKVKI